MLEDLSKYRIRETNSDGALIKSGYIFFEPRFRLQMVRGFAAFAACLFLVIAGLCFWGGLHSFALILAVSMLAVLAWVFSLRPEHLNQKRIIIFTADNRILLSQETKPRTVEPPLSVLPVGVDEIASIETEQSVDGFGNPIQSGPFPLWHVNMYFQDQQSVLVAQDLIQRDTARVITAQIAQALQDINDPYWQAR